MAKVDIERIKAQVAAARAARPGEPLLSGGARWELLSNPQATAFLRSHLEKTGLDLKALERAAGPERPPTPLKPSPAAAKAHARKLAQAVKVRRGQVQTVTSAGARDGGALPLVPPAEIVQPAFIWPTPVGILVEDHLAPDDNWAQVEFTGTSDLGWGGVGFFYFWTNPTQDMIGLSVESPMGLIGSCTAHAKRGFTGGHAHLFIATGLNVYEPGASDVLSVARNDVIDMSVNSFGFWLESESKSAIVDTLIDLSNDFLVVPGGGTIVVEAIAGFGYNNVNGEDTFDFAGAFSRVTSPNMTFTPQPIIIT